MKSVYLAGPISGLSYVEATDWRKEAKLHLKHVGIEALSPMRCKEFLAGLGKLTGTGEEYTHMHPLASSRGVMTRDYYDATHCDVLLVNLLGAKIVSIGTVLEIAWCFQKRTPIVCVIEPKGNIHEHIMIQEALGYKVPTLEEGIDIVKAILLA
jgi:nucleoside 2-deoxyribosyltransferase